MKRILSATTIILMLAACNEAPKPAAATVANPLDTAGLAQYQQMKQQELDVQKAKANEAVYVAPATTTKRSTTSSRSTASTGSSSSTGSGSGTAPAAAPAKKGWSKTAKGAVIGGVTGAAAGAIINKKNRGAGAVIGGVVGAGAGAIIGNAQDKKDGRH
jgi:hypothetical protein